MNRDKESQTDEELLSSARNGDRNAFAELVIKHQHRVAATAKGMLGDTPEAEDVGQETFLRLFRSLRSFRGDAKIETYLTRIAINLSINELHKRRRVKQMSFEEGEKYDNPQSANDSVLELHFERAETQEAVQKAIEMLKPKLRAVVVLRLINGYSTKETSRILRIPQGTVLSRLARAQIKLKNILVSMGWGAQE